MNARSSAWPGSQPSPVAHRNTAIPKEIQTWTCQARVSRWTETVEEKGCMNASRRSEGARMMVRVPSARFKLLHRWHLPAPPVSLFDTLAHPAAQQVVAREGPLGAGQPHREHARAHRAWAPGVPGRRKSSGETMLISEQDPVKPRRRAMLQPPQEEAADGRAQRESGRHLRLGMGIDRQPRQPDERSEDPAERGGRDAHARLPVRGGRARRRPARRWPRAWCAR